MPETSATLPDAPLISAGDSATPAAPDADLLSRLRARCAPLSEHGWQGGVGLTVIREATDILVLDEQPQGYEITPDRLIPLIFPQDVVGEKKSRWLINLFDDAGKPVHRSNYSELYRYLDACKSELLCRLYKDSRTPGDGGVTPRNSAGTLLWKLGEVVGLEHITKKALSDEARLFGIKGRSNFSKGKLFQAVERTWASQEGYEAVREAAGYAALYGHLTEGSLSVSQVQQSKKLLVASVGGCLNAVAIDNGEHYPYGASSFFYVFQSGGGGWPAEALAIILRSDLASFFVTAEASKNETTALSHKTVGRVLLPDWDSIDQDIQQALQSQSTDRVEINQLVYRAYGLGSAEQSIILNALRHGSGGDTGIQGEGVQDVNSAVQHFWSERLAGDETDGDGLDGADSSHKRDVHMAGFLPLIKRVACDSDLPASSVYDARGVTTVPGFYRATKDWDILVIYKGVLLAAIEIKSQIWSEKTDFGKNVNNRCEEALGNAVDLRKAYDKQLFTRNNKFGIAPFIGFLMVLEDCSESRISKDASEPHFFVRQEFVLASTQRRYVTALQGFDSEQVYNGVTLVLTDRTTQGVHDVPPLLSMNRFLRRLRDHIQVGRQQIEYVTTGSVAPL